MYQEAGVDIDKGNQAVKKIKKMVSKMGVKEIGKFSGFFPLKSDLKNPVLVSSSDGVGTKLKIAFLMNKHNNNSYSKNLIVLSFSSIILRQAHFSLIQLLKLSPEFWKDAWRTNLSYWEERQLKCPAFIRMMNMT